MFEVIAFGSLFWQIFYMADNYKIDFLSTIFVLALYSRLGSSIVNSQTSHLLTILQQLQAEASVQLAKSCSSSAP